MCNVINYSINFVYTVTDFLFTLVALLEHQDGVLSPKHAVQFMNVVLCVTARIIPAPVPKLHRPAYGS